MIEYLITGITAIVISYITARFAADKKAKRLENKIVELELKVLDLKVDAETARTGVVQELKALAQVIRALHKVSLGCRYNVQQEEV